MILRRSSNRVPLEEENEPSSLYNEMLVRVQNADIERKKHEKQWRDNPKLVLGDHSEVFETGPHKYFVVNRVRQVVDTHTAVMTENPPHITYEPHEVGEPPDWLLKPTGAMKVQRAEQIAGQPLLEPDQAQGQAFIDDTTAQMLLSIMETQTEQVATGESDEQGQPTTMEMSQQVPVFTDEDFFVVDNKLEADLLTQEVQAQWTAFVNGDSIATEHIFEAQVAGHCDILPQWDDENQHFTLQNLYPYNVWIDPWAQDTTNAEYYIVRELMPISEAKSKWPHLSEFIEHNGAMPGSDAASFGIATSKRIENAGTREVIAVWTWWQRNHPYDREPEEAVEKGLVQPAVDTRDVEAVDPETGETLIDPESELPLMEQEQVPAVDPETGQQVYQLEDGTQVMPGDEHWPKRYGIRQMQFVKDQMVFDQETEFVDIPAARTKCMLIPRTPYGQGEPQRIGELNDLYNHLYSIYYGYFRKFRSPQQAVPQSVYQATQDAVDRLHADPMNHWIIPDHLLNAYGNQVVMNLDPPQLGTVISEMIDRLDATIDKVSGNAGVLQGETKSDQSGELYRLALEAARGPIGLKARHFSNTLRHVGKVVAHLIIEFMDPEVWSGRNTKYPYVVIERVQQRLQRHGPKVIAEVSGAGTREERVRQLQDLWDRGVNTPTLLKNMIDNIGISDGQKIVEEWQQQMMAQAQPQEQ